MIDGFALVSSPYVLIHLGLIDGPFLPHNLISAKESPVPLPKFQMDPRLKILMSSVSRKGTQIHYPFLSRVPASDSPPGFPTGRYGDRYPLTGHFHVSLDISLYLKGPKKRALLHVPQTRGPYGNKYSLTLLNIPFGVHNKGALPPGSPHGVHSDRCPVPRVLLHSTFKILGIRASFLILCSPRT